MIRIRNKALIIQKEDFLAFIFSVYFNAAIIVDVFRLLGQSYIPSISSYTEIFRNIIYLGVIIGIIISLKWYKIKKEFFGVLIAFIFLLGISIIINFEIYPLVLPFLVFFISRCLTGFYLTLHIKNYKKVLVYLEKYKFIIFIYTLLIIKVYSNLSGAYSESSYMAISYNLLQVAMVMLACAICYKKKYYYVFHLYIVIIILIYGARGTLVCLFAFYIFIYLIIKKKKISIKKIIYTFVIIIIMGLILINMDKILQHLGKEYSFSRNLSLINADSLLDFSNRSIQYQVFAEQILNNPLLFRGILSDRLLMSKIFYSEPIYNIYPHNLFLECFYQFGIVLTIIMSIFIFYKFIKKLKEINKYENLERCIFAILVPVPFVYLMFSGSYLIAYTFWMGLGYLLGSEKDK